MQATFGIKNARKFFQTMEAQGKEAQKAAQAALKKEGYRLMRALQDEISEGAPGGRKFKPLSVLGAYRSRPYRRTPLRELANGVRYDLQVSGARTRCVIGFLTKRSSKSWVRIAERAQQGYETTVTPRQRRFLARWASRSLARGTMNRLAIRNISRAAVDTGDAKYFFLRKTTTRMKTPARPIIDPFWRAHERESRTNLVRNFHRKLRGERI